MTTPRTIVLTQGQAALIDADDFDWLSQWKWFARWSKQTRSFYAVRSTAKSEGKQSTVFMHREILGLVKGDKRHGDHRDGNTLNNCRDNLRIANPHQNSCNRQKQTRNTTGYKGVSRFGKRFRATIRVKGKLISLGLRDTAEAAYALYCEAALRLHGEFAHL